MELAVPLGWRVERVVPLIREGPVVMVNSLPQSVLGQTRVDLELWDPQCRNGGVRCLVLEAGLVD